MTHVQLIQVTADLVELVSHTEYSRVELSLFFQAEDGIRDAQESRGLGDVYKETAV